MPVSPPLTAECTQLQGSHVAPATLLDSMRLLATRRGENPHPKLNKHYPQSNVDAVAAFQLASLREYEYEIHSPQTDQLKL
ncbi:hypothetical protein ACLKA7_010426 [Drosophila subpalustris]